MIMNLHRSSNVTSTMSDRIALIVLLSLGHIPWTRLCDRCLSSGKASIFAVLVVSPLTMTSTGSVCAAASLLVVLCALIGEKTHVVSVHQDILYTRFKGECHCLVTCSEQYTIRLTSKEYSSDSIACSAQACAVAVVG